MTYSRTALVGLSAALALSVVPVAATATIAGPRRSPTAESSRVLLDWETTSIRTISPETATAVPVGGLSLGSPSLGRTAAAGPPQGGRVLPPRGAAVGATTSSPST